MALSASEVQVILSTIAARGAPYSGGVPLSLNYHALPASGTSSGQLDLVWGDTYTIGTSATQALDFTALADGPTGASVNMVKVDWIAVQGVAANTGVLHLKANATNGLLAFLADASDILKYPAGDAPLLIPCGGYATSGSLKALDLINASASVTWTGTIYVFGRSA